MSVKSVRLHLTNIAGLGAVQLLKSLLPALEQCESIRLKELYLPSVGELSEYVVDDNSINKYYYRRYLPNSISRFLECVFFGRRFGGDTPLLVMGDLPIRCSAKQTVFVQNSHLLVPDKISWNKSSLKFLVFRWIFSLNIRYAQAFIVQTALMRDALIKSYPSLRARVHVVPQPVPSWLLNAGVVRGGRVVATDAPLRLFYPAADYPHKNHKLLDSIQANSASQWPVESLELTIEQEAHPAKDISWIHCCGRLSSQRMLDSYNLADALLFLSKDESYGFPLVEAMFIGIPIVCPDLEYARALCGDQAIYFVVDDVESLRCAVDELHRKLSTGYWPDWSEQLKMIPKDWDSVGRRILEIAVEK